jgi:hypothetical protein
MFFEIMYFITNSKIENHKPLTQVTFVVSTHLTLDCGRQKYFFACVNVRGIGLATLYEEEFKSLGLNQKPDWLKPHILKT